MVGMSSGWPGVSTEVRKARTTRYHYSKGRVCKDCEDPITDHNESGYCRTCQKIRKDAQPKTRVAETDAHRRLKAVAAKWLETIGCIDIKQEVPFVSTEGQVIFDVVGTSKKALLIAVECGGSHARKLKIALTITPDLYILAYNSTTPCLYREGMDFCHLCGNLKEM